MIGSTPSTPRQHLLLKGVEAQVESAALLMSHGYTFNTFFNLTRKGEIKGASAFVAIGVEGVKGVEGVEGRKAGGDR
jgi:hypothetical protein